MQNRCEGAWEEWKFVPTSFKDTMFKHFQKRWQWDERDTQLIRRAWNRHFNKSYKDELTKARKRAKVKASTNDIADTSGHDPSWIAPEHWDELITKWSQEKWRARSQKASVSRQTEHNGSMVKHTAGSIPISQHRLVLERELGRMPTQSELFQRTHRSIIWPSLWKNVVIKMAIPLRCLLFILKLGARRLLALERVDCMDFILITHQLS